MTKYQQPFSLNCSKNTKLKISLCHTQLTSTSQLSKNSVTVLTQAFQLQQSNTFQLTWGLWVTTNKQMNTAFQSVSKTVLDLITTNSANTLLPYLKKIKSHTNWTSTHTMVVMPLLPFVQVPKSNTPSLAQASNQATHTNAHTSTLSNQQNALLTLT